MCHGPWEGALSECPLNRYRAQSASVTANSAARQAMQDATLAARAHRSIAPSSSVVRPEPGGATTVARKRAPASRGPPRSLRRNPAPASGAATTLTLSSPLPPGGPNAARGSATSRRGALRGAGAPQHAAAGPAAGQSARAAARGPAARRGMRACGAARRPRGRCDGTRSLRGCAARR